MNLQHVNVKIFVDGELSVDPERFIEVFHRWVADQSMDELLIDIADYRHVPNGPSVALVGLEADYVLDNARGRYGLVYNRKAVIDGSNQDRIRQAFTSAATACSLLEAEFDGLKFSGQEFEVFINDRALAPNTAETYEAVKPELEAFLQAELGASDFSLEHDNSDPRRLFAVAVKLASGIDLTTVAAS